MATIHYHDGDPLGCRANFLEGKCAQFPLAQQKNAIIEVKVMDDCPHGVRKDAIHPITHAGSLMCEKCPGYSVDLERFIVMCRGPKTL